jgi:AcrR family transcriptional regulator
MADPPPRRPGRRAGESSARREILDAARELFSAAGYDATSIRAIARRAGVDPGLVLHYFSDKAHVFSEAMYFPLDPEDAVARIVPGPRRAMGRRLAAFFIGVWDEPESRDPIIGLLRGATTSPHVAALLRTLLTERVLSPVGERLGTPDSELRMSLCSAQLLGMATARYILCLEQLVSLSADDVVDVMGPPLQHFLTGPLRRDNPAIAPV